MHGAKQIHRGIRKLPQEHIIEDIFCCMFYPGSTGHIGMDETGTRGKHVSHSFEPIIDSIAIRSGKTCKMKIGGLVHFSPPLALLSPNNGKKPNGNDDFAKEIHGRYVILCMRIVSRCKLHLALLFLLF